MKYPILMSIISVGIITMIVVSNILLPGSIIALSAIESVVVGIAFTLISIITMGRVKKKFGMALSNFNNIQKSVTNPSIITNKDKVIVSVNKSLLELGEYSEAELINRKLSEIYSYPNLVTKSGDKIVLEAQLWPLNFGGMEIFLLLGSKNVDSIGIEKSLECYGIGALECNSEGIIYTAHGGLIDILGLSRVYKSNKELVGKSVYDMAQFNNLNSNSISEDQVTTLETEARTIKGEIKIYSVCIVRLENDMFYVTLRDITGFKARQKAIEASNHRYKTIVNVAPIGIMVVDNKMNIKEFNAYFASMLGSEHPELFIESKISKITGLSETGIIDNIKSLLTTGIPTSDRVKFLSQYGKTSSFTYIITPIKDDDFITGAFLLVEDEGRSK